MTLQYLSGNRITGLSSDTKPTTTQDKAVFYQTNDFKTFDFTLSSTTWTERTSGGVVNDNTTFNSFVADISDGYATPTTSESSSVASSVLEGTHDVSNEGSGGDINKSGSSWTYGGTIPSFALGLNIHSVDIRLMRHGEATATTIGLRIKSSSGSIRHTFTTTYNTATLSAGWSANPPYKEFISDTPSNFVVNSGDTIELFKSGGNTGSFYFNNFISVDYVYNIDKEITFVSSHVRNSGYADIDVTKTTQETNPHISVGMNNDSIISEVGIYLETDNTETEFQIQTSSDNTNWTTQRTILTSNLTAEQWNYIRLNLHTARYVKVKGSSGLSKVMSIKEIKVKKDVTLDSNHGHGTFDSTDTSLGLNGMSA
jgi:hypothetical protein